MLVLLTTGVSMEAKKVKPVKKTSWELVSNHSEKGMLITFDCDSTRESPKFLSNFVCENGTDERIYIEWENARMKGDRIVFGNDSRTSMRNPKTDEAVSPHRTSIIRKIASVNQVHSDYMANIVYWSREKELMKELGQKESVEIVIPIRFVDNHVEEYRFVFSMWYEKPTE